MLRPLRFFPSGTSEQKILKKGFTLLELLVALAIFTIVIGGVYSFYVYIYHHYIHNNRVSAVQQDSKAVLDIISREIRMAGGGFGEDDLTRFDDGKINGLDKIINDDPAGAVLDMIVGYFWDGYLYTAVGPETNIITVTDFNGIADGAMDTNLKKYLSIGGMEVKQITNVIFNNGIATVTLDRNLRYQHKKGTPVFLFKRVTYTIDSSNSKNSLLLRDEHLGSDSCQIVADHIEDIKVDYKSDNELCELLLTVEPHGFGSGEGLQDLLKISRTYKSKIKKRN